MLPTRPFTWPKTWVATWSFDTRGAWITQRLGLSKVGISYLLNHHHRYYAHTDPARGDDGSAPDVPIGAKILCVADALVTMLSDRTYRSARTVPEALRGLRRESGRQFDPEVVDVVYRFHVPSRMAAWRQDC